MIDFSNFYQLIAKSPLSHWLETLPAQCSRPRQRDALHGKFREWERAVEFLPELTPSASGSSAQRHRRERNAAQRRPSATDRKSA